MAKTQPSGRGELAVADMKARVAAGWTFDMLWDRMAAAEAGAGYSYEYAEALPAEDPESVAVG